jgi:hypothetical protein
MPGDAILNSNIGNNFGIRIWDFGICPEFLRNIDFELA